jgi:class 3 adenylate cyclase
MDELSAAELAARAGVSEREIERMVELGILSPQGSGSSFRPADVQVVHLAWACEEGGLPMKDIGASIAAGRLSFSFLEAFWFRRFAPLSAITLVDAARDAGVAPDVLGRSLEAFGYPGRGPHDTLREDELELVRLVGPPLSGGLVDEAAIVRWGRVWSESLRRIASAETELYHNKFEMPLLSSGLSQGETMSRAAGLSDRYSEPVEPAFVAAYRRHQELATIEHQVGHIESALEESGLYRRAKTPAAMCFLDLEGYTRLTEELGDREGARLAETLAGVVDRRTREHRGQPVKWLGDGVMSYFRDPAGAVAAALDMVEDAPRAGLPPAHVGVAAGPVVVQGGDYFGRTVNSAARISAYARGGQVLVDEIVAESPAPPGVAFREVGQVELKGLLKPARLFQASRT